MSGLNRDVLFGVSLTVNHCDHHHRNIDIKEYLGIIVPDYTIKEVVMRGLLNLSDSFSLGLHAACYLAGAERGPVSTREMASRLGVSEAHLAKVLQRLERRGILGSRRGPGGGFFLLPDAGRRPLMDIYESLEGPFRPRDCLLPTRTCGGESCIMRGMLERVNREFEAYLRGTTLDDLRGSLSGRAEGGKDRRKRRNSGG